MNRRYKRSVVACAAYRAGESLRDKTNNMTFNYAKRKGVVYSTVMLPAGADPRLANREYLWNEVERVERRKDAQLAREFNLALPHELNAKKRQELLLNFVREQFVSKGMVADVAIHEPVEAHGDHKNNHHAHVMLTLRKANKNGFARTKTREWNAKEQMNV